MTSALPIADFPGCPGCARFAAGPARSCFACACRQLSRPGADACPVCAQRRGAGGFCANELCRSPRRRIARIRAIGYQAGPLRRCINGYKYRGGRDWSAVFGRLLLGWLDENLTGDRPHLIVANPGYAGPGSHAFPHAEAVLAAAAQAAAAQAGDCDRWKFDDGAPAAIVKVLPTLRSADAQAWSKRASGYELRDALRVPEPGRTAGKFVLVYDDVCTTGTQLDAVAGCLLDQGGASRVEGIVLARAPWRNPQGGAQARALRRAG